MTASRAPIEPSRMLLVILVVVDFLLLTANVVHWRLGADDPVFSNSAWDGDLDQSYIENFGHILLISAVVMLLFILSRRVVLVLVGWTLVLVALVIDDLFMVHERGGEALAVLWKLPTVAGVRNVDFGELLVWGAMIVPLGIVLVIGHLRAGPADRRDSRTLFVLVAVLAAFAVVLDTVSHPIGELVAPQVGTLLTLFETSGELVAMSLIVVAVHRMTTRVGGEDQSASSSRIPSSSAATVAEADDMRDDASPSVDHPSR